MKRVTVEFEISPDGRRLLAQVPGCAAGVWEIPIVGEPGERDLQALAMLALLPVINKFASPFEPHELYAALEVACAEMRRWKEGDES